MLKEQKIVMPYKDLLLSFIGSSLIGVCLSFIVNSYIMAIPLYIYSLIVGVFTFLLFKQKIKFDSILLPKIIMDLCFTLYWTIAYTASTKSTVFYFLPIVAMLIYVNTNLLLYKGKIIENIMIFYSIIGCYLPLLLFDKDDVTILYPLVYAGISIYILFYSKVSLKYKIENDMETQTVLNRLISHDINNTLVVLELLKDFSKQTPISENTHKILCNVFDSLNDTKKLLNGGMFPTEFRPTRILRMLSVNLPNMNVKIKDNFKMHFSIPLFLSITRNLYNNSKEYADSKKLPDFDFRVYDYDEDTICFEDNCGGFLNLDDIKNKKSTKTDDSDEHGVFLNSLIWESEKYNINTRIKNYEFGVKIYVQFPKKDKIK